VTTIYEWSSPYARLRLAYTPAGRLAFAPDGAIWVFAHGQDDAVTLAKDVTAVLLPIREVDQLITALLAWKRDREEGMQGCGAGVRPTNQGGSMDQNLGTDETVALASVGAEFELAGPQPADDAASPLVDDGELDDTDHTGSNTDAA
jgi:hypothetical protein